MSVEHGRKPAQERTAASAPAGGTTAALDQFRSSLKTILTSLDRAVSELELQRALYPQLDSSGFLHDLNGNGTADDRALTKDASGQITISMNVGLERIVSTDPATGQGFQFSLGLPGMPLTVRSGSVQVSAGFAYDLAKKVIDAEEIA